MFPWRVLFHDYDVEAVGLAEQQQVCRKQLHCSSGCPTSTVRPCQQPCVFLAPLCFGHGLSFNSMSAPQIAAADITRFNGQINHLGRRD